MRLVRSVVPAAALLFLAACGTGGTPGATPTTTAAQPTVTKAPTPTPSPSTQTPTTAVTPPLPHFATPQDAGRYLADKWNAKDATALHHITNGDSRAALDNMRTFAVNLRLDKCTKNDDGTYTCDFTHSFLPGKSDPDSVPTDASHDGPAAKSDPHHGHTALKAVAVSKTGWYFNVFLYCG